MFFPRVFETGGNYWWRLSLSRRYVAVGQSFITAKSIKIVTFTEKRFKLKKTILNSASFSFQPFESQVSWLHRLELFSRHLERDQKALPLVSFPFYFGCRLLVVTVLQRWKPTGNCGSRRNSTVFEYVTVKSLLHSLSNLFAKKKLLHIFFTSYA